jgi:cell wall assembly regulator SMI1
MGDAAGELRSAVSQGLVELEPPLPPAAIDALADELGVALPSELRQVLELTAGVDGASFDTLDFSGRSLSFGGDFLFPHGHTFAGDGYGNHWVLDLVPGETDVSPVFYACHDPAVVVFQSASLGDFLFETFLAGDSLIDSVHDDAAFRVWSSHPDELDHAAALGSDDALRAFAETLDERFVFYDLRRPSVGDGFAWGRFGPRTDVRRHGDARVFACAPPEQRPGRLSRFFGRG